MPRFRQFSRPNCAGPIAEREPCLRDRTQRPAWIESKTSEATSSAWDKGAGTQKAQEAQNNLVRLVPLVFLRFLLRGFRLPTDLLLNLPVREQIFMAATRALPRTLYGVGATLVKHLDDQVAMKTHRWMTQNQFAFCRLRNNCHI